MKDFIAQAARRFAETMLYWKGYLHAKEIQGYMGVSERTARSMISDWRDQGLLPPYRNYTQRRLVPFEDFDPGPCVTDPRITYSLLLAAEDFPGNPFSSVGLAEWRARPVTDGQDFQRAKSRDRCGVP